MSKNYILCHGFNVRDAGKETIDKLLPHMQIDEVQQADYGYFNLFGVRWFNKSIATTLAGMSNRHSIGIGHSNGCAILVEAARHTNNIEHLILINPALDNDTSFPNSVKKIDVFYNQTDKVVTISKWMPWHVWGDMGRVGFKGSDSRVRNHNTRWLFDAHGHSGALIDHSKKLMEYIRSL